ncbi:hypothetical protein B0O99DRAFT_178377 [Bisporella sp. PMI_857]|nr:hypothetical protein B0O99DRAFT_178377 [Bisporella sp. PMI_857]
MKKYIGSLKFDSGNIILIINNSIHYNNNQQHFQRLSSIISSSNLPIFSFFNQIKIAKMVSFTYIVATATLVSTITAAPLAMVAANVVGGALAGRDQVFEARDTFDLYTRDPAKEKPAKPATNEPKKSQTNGVKKNKDNVTPHFKNCASQLKSKKPKVQKLPGQIVNIDGLPPVCMTAVKTWNARPDIKAQQAKQGVAKITGPASVTLTKMPANVVDMLDG